MKIKLLLLAILFTNIVSSQNQILLSTGNQGGNYYSIGSEICDSLNKKYEKIQFKAVPSDGSNENIDNLGKRLSNLAIIQRDVLIKNLYHNNPGIKNIEIISPLFQEALLIYVDNKKGSLSFREFVNEIENGNIQKIGVGRKNGHTEEVLAQIFKHYSVGDESLFMHNNSYDTHINQLQNNKIQAIALLSKPLDKLDNDNFSIVTFSQEEVKEIQIYQRNSSIIELDTLQFPCIDRDKKHYSIGSWAFLVGISKDILLIDQVDTNTLLQNLIHTTPKDESKTTSLFEHYYVVNNIDQVVTKNIEFKQKLFEGLPLNQSLEAIIEDSNVYLTGTNLFILLLSFVFITILVYFYIYDQYTLMLIWHRYTHLLFGVMFFVAIYFLSIELLLSSERELFNEFGIKSGILDLTTKDLHIWYTTSTFTGEYSGMYPISNTGKFIVSFATSVTWILTIIIAFLEVLKRRLTRKRKEGIMTIKNENHLVICGWNEQTEKMVLDTIHAIENYHDSTDHIVCIVENSESIIESNKDLEKLHISQKLSFVKGNVRDELVLQKANVHKSKTVVLLSEDKSLSSDEKTLLRALAISRFCRSKEMEEFKNKNPEATDLSTMPHHFIDSIYIIAEINDPTFTKDLKRWDVNEVVCTNNYGKNIIIQSMLNHGVTNILDEVLNFNEQNEFYNINLKDQRFEKLRNRVFDDLLTYLRKYNILLLGIKSAYYKDDKEIVDENQINHYLKSEDLTRQYIINPNNEIENSKVVGKNDQLIVLCSNNEDINKLANGLKRIGE